MTTIIPFDELISGATVRFTVIDGVQYLCVLDLIMDICGKHRHYSAEIWRNLSESFKTEVGCFLRYFKFPGRGQQEQPVIQFKGAVKLLMWLPGENAKKFRCKASEILTRYYAGDKTLIADICDNAESRGAMNEAARAALPQLDDDHIHKQKALEIHEDALQRSREERHLKTVSLQNKIMEMYATLCPGNQLDDRASLHFNDVISSAASAK